MVKIVRGFGDPKIDSKPDQFDSEIYSIYDKRY